MRICILRDARYLAEQRCLPFLVCFRQAMTAGTVSVRQGLCFIFKEYPVLCHHPFAGSTLQQTVDPVSFMTAERDVAFTDQCPGIRSPPRRIDAQFYMMYHICNDDFMVERRSCSCRIPAIRNLRSVQECLRQLLLHNNQYLSHLVAIAL
ncbi:hypothetical protein SAMN04487894_10694 [Niabella drilacis]|uniref:Uncharacterized protein n=1 Tax=Niabella drilacis (strain DSM 25811 / CCM 8410 / CCUG 62505 / LMG 26954 / E90) TaxID=1285928 RepID=A0A1G6S5C5_NIADE|nr:hypothetical protein SAMN04487894_10694 [Niabella drilacis]